MEVVGVMPSHTARGRVKCPWCPKSWKRHDQEFIDNHVQKNHYEEYVDDQYKRSNRTLKNKNILLENEVQDLKRQLADAKKPPAKKQEYYQCVLYCTVENKVFKAGMPKGVLPENVVCSNCGVRGALKITNNDPSWII